MNSLSQNDVEILNPPVAWEFKYLVETVSRIFYSVLKKAYPRNMLMYFWASKIVSVLQRRLENNTRTLMPIHALVVILSQVNNLSLVFLVWLWLLENRWKPFKSWKTINAVANFNIHCWKILFLEVIARQLFKQQRVVNRIWFANVKAFTETSFIFSVVLRDPELGRT